MGDPPVPLMETPPEACFVAWPLLEPTLIRRILFGCFLPGLGGPTCVIGRDSSIELLKVVPLADSFTLATVSEQSLCGLGCLRDLTMMPRGGDSAADVLLLNDSNKVNPVGIARGQLLRDGFSCGITLEG